MAAPGVFPGRAGPRRAAPPVFPFFFSSRWRRVRIAGGPAVTARGPAGHSAAGEKQPGMDFTKEGGRVCLACEAGKKGNAREP